ncbi:cysteine peptidase family C39 domain-containing protein, partial [Acinetobacter baumannii]
RTPVPAICVDHAGHFFVLAKIDAAPQESPGTPLRILIQRPGQAPQVLTRSEFMALWGGQVILMTSQASYAGESSRFD